MSYLVKNFPIFAIVTLPRIAYNGYVRREDETMNVTVYSFFEVGNHYEYVKDNEITVLSAEMMDCMVTQYKVCGYMVDHLDGIICVSIVNNAIENFSKKIAKKGWQTVRDMIIYSHGEARKKGRITMNENWYENPELHEEDVEELEELLAIWLYAEA